MNSEWKPFTELLSKIVDNRGKTCPLSDSGLPLIATNCVNNDTLYPSYNTNRYISDETYKNWFRGHPLPGDILFVCKGSPGRTNWVPKPVDFCIAQDMVAVRPDPTKIYPKYLFAALRSPEVQSQINNMHVGTMIPHFKKGDFDKLKIPVPPRDIQIFIGNYYFTISERIALLSDTSFTLEAVAQSLFKSWFVDFDPVRAKSEGRAVEGIDSETAALFPDSFEETSFGLVPTGWKLTPFGELLGHTVGGDWGDDTPNDKNTTRVAIIRGTDIPDLRAGKSNRVPIRYTSSKKLSTRILRDGDLVLEISGGSKDQPTGRSLYITNGMLAQFDCPVEPASFCRLLRPVNHDIGVLLGQHMVFIYNQGKTWEYQNQSTGLSNFQTARFLQAELVALAPENILRTFANIIRPMVDRSHLEHIAYLTRLRDALLPSLISGQFKISANALNSESA